MVPPAFGLSAAATLHLFMTFRIKAEPFRPSWRRRPSFSSAHLVFQLHSCSGPCELVLRRCDVTAACVLLEEVVFSQLQPSCLQNDEGSILSAGDALQILSLKECSERPRLI